MEIDKVERRLKKIITVFDAFKEDGKISSIEKDLLLGYIRELYEIVQETDIKSDAQTSSHHHKAPIHEFAMPKIEQVHTHEVAAESIIPTPQIIEKEPEILDVIAKVKKEEILNQGPISSNVMNEHFTSHLNHKKAEEPIVPVVTEVVQDHSSEMEKLFVISKAIDLSDKLAMSHIDDINKAMGINERLFNQNELFGGNQVLFSETISYLNKLTTFEEAKAYLINGIAKEQKWDTDSKSSKAHQFIKLIYRKYN